MTFATHLSTLKGLSKGSITDDQRICKAVCYGFREVLIAGRHDICVCGEFIWLVLD